MLDTLPRRTERRKRRSRRGLIILLVLLLMMVVAIVAGGAYYEWATGASGPQTPIVVTIPTGATGADVADLLGEDHVIRSPLAFRLLARFRGFSSGFEAGKYHMKTNMTVDQALAALKAGPFVESKRVTFPEGFTVEQMAGRAHEGLGIRKSDFVKAATSGSISVGDYLPKGKKTVEGFLFPSTYDFLKDATARDVIGRLVSQFESEAEKLPWANAESLGVTKYDVVIVSSLIEREAKFDQDRQKIAAVIYNRLKKGMALQIDATVQYALGNWDPITVKDRQVNSPYNTYVHTGLPPTPIASAGIESLEAALNPAHADYLYYVVIDAAGHHAFTDSYSEFVRLKNKYKG